MAIAVAIFGLYIERSGSYNRVDHYKEVLVGKKEKTPCEGKKKEEGIVVEGVITEALKSGFLVEIVAEGAKPDPENRGHIINAHLGGKLRKNFIRIVEGDRVRVELSPYDLTKGRITFRMK